MINQKKNGPETIMNEIFNSFESRLNGGKDNAFHKMRLNAFDRYNSLGFPGLKHEEYKYTHLISRVPAGLHLPEQKTEPFDPGYLSTILPDFPGTVQMLFINGMPSGSLILPDEYKNKVEVLPMKEAIQKDRDILRNLLTAELENNNDPFIPLNTALTLNGLYINIADGTRLQIPLFIIHYTDTAESALMINNKNVVVGGKGCHFKFAEIFIGRDGQTSFENHCTSIIAGEDSNLHYAKVQVAGNQAVHVSTTIVHQKKNSIFNAYSVSLSGSMIRNNLNISLDEPNCESHLTGLFFPSGKDHIDNHTQVDHRVPNCYSNELYKGILDGQSKGVFNGKIFVRPQAQKTNAYQSNKNILLTDTASIDTKPQLEIWADDVKCSHGTSTGKIDEEQLFYLRARGIGEEAARSLLIYAFAHDVSDKIQMDGIKSFIDKLIQERLQQTF
jgi:Fe-S cluster assembly protein SufD